MEELVVDGEKKRTEIISPYYNTRHATSLGTDTGAPDHVRGSGEHERAKVPCRTCAAGADSRKVAERDIKAPGASGIRSRVTARCLARVTGRADQLGHLDEDVRAFHACCDTAPLNALAGERPGHLGGARAKRSIFPLYSKVLCWAGLDSAIGLEERLEAEDRSRVVEADREEIREDGSCARLGRAGRSVHPVLRLRGPGSPST